MEGVSRNLVDKSNFVGGSVQPVTLATMYKDKLLYAYFNMAYAEFQNLPPVIIPENKKELGLSAPVCYKRQQPRRNLERRTGLHRS